MSDWRTEIDPDILAAMDTLKENVKGRIALAIGIVSTIGMLWLNGDLSFPSGLGWPVSYAGVAVALTSWDYWKVARLFP